MVTAIDDERYYTVAEVADVLGLSQNSIRRMIRRGELGYSRHTRWLRISYSDLNAYLDETHRPEPVAPKARGRR